MRQNLFINLKKAVAASCDEDERATTPNHSVTGALCTQNVQQFSEEHSLAAEKWGRTLKKRSESIKRRCVSNEVRVEF